eukprot:scaffold46653_cov64-Phaeocystis_antarctica.AAC.5
MRTSTRRRGRVPFAPVGGYLRSSPTSYHSPVEVAPHLTLHPGSTVSRLTPRLPLSVLCSPNARWPYPAI